MNEKMRETTETERREKKRRVTALPKCISESISDFILRLVTLINFSRRCSFCAFKMPLGE